MVKSKVKSLIKPRRKFKVIEERGRIVTAISHNDPPELNIIQRAIDAEPERLVIVILQERILKLEARFDKMRRDFGEVVRLLLDNNHNKSLVRINQILRAYSNLNT